MLTSAFIHSWSPPLAPYLPLSIKLHGHPRWVIVYWEKGNNSTHTTESTLRITGLLTSGKSSVPGIAHFNDLYRLPQTTHRNTVYSTGIKVAWVSRFGSDSSEARVLSSTSSLLNGGWMRDAYPKFVSFICTAAGAHRPVGIKRRRPTSRSATGVCLRTLTFPLNSSLNKPHLIPTGYTVATHQLSTNR